MKDTVSRFIELLKIDFQRLYSLLFEPSAEPEPELMPQPLMAPPMQTSPYIEAVEADERREAAKPTGEIPLPKGEPPTEEEKKRWAEKSAELKARQKETGSDQAYEDYVANKEEIQISEGTHQKIGGTRREIYRK